MHFETYVFDHLNFMKYSCLLNYVCLDMGVIIILACIIGFCLCEQKFLKEKGGAL